MRRLCRGVPVKAGTKDKQEALRRLLLRRLTDGQIAYLMGRSRRAVMRSRQLLGLPPTIPRNTSNGQIVPNPDIPRGPRK